MTKIHDAGRPEGNGIDDPLESSRAADITRLATVAAATDAEPPSVLKAAPAFVALAIAIGCSDNFADPDLWMHILEGRIISRTGHIPLYDTFSYSAAGMPWHNHEWLAQVLLAISYDGLGILGLKLLKLFCTTVIIAALAIGLARSAAPLGVQRVLLVAAAVGIAPELQFRPQMFTLAMLSILMATLAENIYRRRDRLWPLLPMFALWANLHGGFLIGLAVLGIYSVTLGLWELVGTGKVARAYKPALIAVGCALATLLNPLGPGLWPNVLHSVSDTLIRSFIADWIPLIQAIIGDWHTTPLEDLISVVPLLMFLAFFLALLAAPTMDDAPLIAVALVTICAAFYSGRNLPLAVICVTIPLAHHLGPALRRLPRAERIGTSTAPNSFLVCGAALAIATAGGLLSNRLKTFAPVPSGAVAFMEDHDLHGNILNFFSWGEYLIWHCSPSSRVFIDGRTELVYPDNLLREYALFLYGLPGGTKILSRYPHDFLLLSPDTKDYGSVATDPRWKLIYHDSASALFAKARSPIAKTFERPVQGQATSYFP